MTSRKAEGTEPTELCRQALDRLRGGAAVLCAAERDGDDSASGSTYSGENIYVSSTGQKVWS